MGQISITKHQSALPEPIAVLESYLARAGTSVIEAAFRYSFFIDPDRVRERTPYFPDRARMSREHYPKGDRGDVRQWNGVDVRLGDNARAQMAWAKYTGTPIARGSGYGVRHIWGNPWDPNAFTAGWNLCYMPFWLGMLTEDQHPYPDLVKVIQQVSFDLYFRHRPVCDKPEYVVDHGIAISEVIGDANIQLLVGSPREPVVTRRGTTLATSGDPRETVLAIRKARNASWSNVFKALAALQHLPHDTFGTANVENTSKSIVRTMERQTGLSLRELDVLVRDLAAGR